MELELLVRAKVFVIIKPVTQVGIMDSYHFIVRIFRRINWAIYNLYLPRQHCKVDRERGGEAQRGHLPVAEQICTSAHRHRVHKTLHNCCCCTASAIICMQCEKSYMLNRKNWIAQKWSFQKCMHSLCSGSNPVRSKSWCTQCQMCASGQIKDVFIAGLMRRMDCQVLLVPETHQFLRYEYNATWLLPFRPNFDWHLNSDF